ncbi:hypothetical protein ACLBXO_18170 [Methylobacterium sp. C33D]|uniref:hypothetical protein n=1 Tax=Methylobacterium mesophilicum TaxID=39956 RepID=UPI002F340290
MSTSANPPNPSAETAALRKDKLRAHIRSVLSTIRSHHTARGASSIRTTGYVLGGWFCGAAAASIPLFT